MIIKRLAARLDDFRSRNLYRYRHVVTHESKFINFSSNDYLALSQHPQLIAAMEKGMQQYGIGSGASKLVAGYTAIHRDCETLFAEFLGRDRALLFGSGYLANLGTLDAVTNKGDIVFQDRHNHASLLDAARLSRAKLQRYLHNNIENLIKKMESVGAQQKLVVSDGVFSMYGDVAPVSELAKCCKQHDATLMIDDAHGMGVLGKNGGGVLEQLQLSQENVPILVCPLGKAFGLCGAMVAGSNDLIESLIQFARSYIYTTAIPPALAAATMASLELVKKEQWRREKLNELIHYFKIEANKIGLYLKSSDTPIQAILMKDIEQATTVSHNLRDKGYLLYAMRPPTVPEKKSLLRVTLNVSHTKNQIRDLLNAIQA